MYQYVISGDSILNGHHYKKLYYRDLDDVDPEIILSEEFYCFLREDTLYQKVYAIVFNHLHETGCPNNEEYQLYDFDLEVGDTTEMCLIDFWGDQWIIFEIGYQMLFGQERKVFNTDNIPDYLIEGVGTNSGLLEYGYFEKENKPENKGGWYELLNYCIGTDEECGYLWVGIEDGEEIPMFKIYPNPLTGNTIKLVSQTPITQPLDVKLYDITGKEVYQRHFENITREVNIQIPARLSSGTSPLLLWAGNSRQMFFKQLIVKQ